MDWKERTELLIRDENLQKLNAANILVAGLGGVGGAAAEMLVRSGIGRLTIVDSDVVQSTNRNRQLIALCSTEGKMKAEIWKERLLDINPDLELNVITEFIRDQRMIELLDNGYDYIVDAIDTLSPKVFLIYHSLQRNIPVVSSMGAGGKMNPEEVRIGDISQSNTCKLALYIRKRLHKLGVYNGVKVVFSTEKVSKECIRLVEGESNKLSTVGTVSYMPNIFGCFCASVVIRDMIAS